MKAALLSLIPPSLRLRLRRRQIDRLLRREGRADTERFQRFAVVDPGSPDLSSAVQIEARITKTYHSIEKGFSLPDVRRPFGEKARVQLAALVPAAERLAADAPWLEVARDALDAQRVWNDGGADLDVVAPAGDVWRGTVPPEFFRSRRSVRNFSTQPVDDAVLREAIELASAAPSVCNRAPWRVRLYRGEDLPRVLSVQNGNRGFTDNIPVVAVISVELGAFIGVIERFQPWIEGGIFASTLQWALHAQGLQSCMLNLSLLNAHASRLRTLADIPESEVPITMMAIGHAADGHRVARSRRRTVDEILVSRP